MMIRIILRLVIVVTLLSGAVFMSSAQQISASKFPGDLIQQLIVDIDNNKYGFRVSSAELDVLVNNLEIEKHDLNGDGVTEFFLHINHTDWCGAGGNCSYWVYQRTGTGYKLLLEDKEIWVKDTRTNGYRDLASETPMGFCKRNVQRLYVTPYKYDGVVYKAQRLEVDCRSVVRTKN
jgi:hypothetical protein